MSRVSQAPTRVTWILVAAFLALVSHEGRAQSAWPSIQEESYVEAEFGHPFVDRDNTPFGSLVLAGRVGISPRVRLVAEIPLSFGTEWSGSGVSRNMGLGNVYIGLDANTQSSTSDVAMRTEFGLTLPLIADDAEYTGGALFTHLVERPASVLSNTVSVTASEFVGIPLTEQIALQFRLGPSVWIPTESGPDTEILAVYGARLWFESSGFAAGFGLRAWTWLSESDASFDERTMQHLVFDAQYSASSVVPFVAVKMGIGGDDDDYLDGGILMTVGARLPILR